MYSQTNEHRLNDTSIKYTGYYIDNGAYYYDHTENGRNHQQTVLGVIHYDAQK